MERTSSSIALIIPTLNAAPHWPALHTAISLQSRPPDRVLIVDSSSSDQTRQLAQQAGFDVLAIARDEFNHGKSRQLAAQQAADCDFLVYLTQDAVLADTAALELLLQAFQDPMTGAAYGRQLPHPSAQHIETHARLFNYPERSSVRTFSSRHALGFKSIFFSNSFGAYRRSALLSVGGFPADIIFGEDTVVAARLHRAGWNTAYVADARVYHSHRYSIAEEFRRYFDIGVLHAREAWLVQEFGTAHGEGLRFVLSELNYLKKRNAAAIPSSLLHSAAKYLGYRLGRNENQISLTMKRLLSQNKSYWL